MLNLRVWGSEPSADWRSGANYSRPDAARVERIKTARWTQVVSDACGAKLPGCDVHSLSLMALTVKRIERRSLATVANTYNGLRRNNDGKSAPGRPQNGG